MSIGLISQRRRLRAAQPALPWTTFVNFGLDGKTSDDIAGWNNVKATSGQIAAGATFTGLKNTDGGDIPITIQTSSATLLERTSQIIHDLATDQKVYKTNYEYGSAGGTMTISGLDDDKFYKVTIIGCAVLTLAPYIVFYTRCVLNGVDLPIQQDHDNDLDFDKTLYYIRAQDVKPTGGVLQFEFYPTTEVPPGYDINYSLSGLKIEEFSASTGWEYPVDIVPAGDSPVPYVIRVPEVVVSDTPLIISLPTGGTEGVGTGDLDHINWIFTETLTKPLLNGSEYLPEDAIIASPQFFQNAWNQGLLSDFIEYLIDEYSLNGRSIYLMGFSAGMEVGLAYIGEAYRPVRAAVFGSSTYTGEDYPGEAPDYSKIAATRTPIWIFGSNEDPLVPFASFIDVRDRLLEEDSNYPIKVTVFEDDTHYRPMTYLYNNRADTVVPIPLVEGYDGYIQNEHWDWMLSQPEPVIPTNYDEDFQAVIDEATSLSYAIPETKYLNMLNDAVVACKDSGIFQKADLLLFFATGSNEDTDFKSINYKNPSHKASLVNLEISRHGVVGTGTDSYINTLYNPSTMGDNYTLNNAGRASWVFKLFSDSESPVTHAVLDSANSNTNMVDLNTSGSHRINSGTMGLNSGTFNMGGLGFKGINRINSEDLTLYNGKTRGNNSRTSSEITNAFQFVLRRGTNYGTSGISFYYMGAALTEQESNDFSDLISNLLSSIGPTAPLLSRNNIEVVSGGTEIVSATGEAGTTIVWKDSLGGVVYNGDTLTIPTSVNGQFSYFAYAVNEDGVESEPSIFSVLVRSVDDLVLLTPTDTYIESTDTLVIKNISPSSVTIEYYDDSNNLIQTDGDLTLSGLTVGTHSYYAVPKSGATTFNPVDITVRVLEEFPEVDSSEYFTLTIVDGIPDEHIIYNEEVQPFKTRVFAKNTVVNNIYLENPNYVFSPRTTSVIMDSDKTITFTPTTV